MAGAGGEWFNFPVERYLASPRIQVLSWQDRGVYIHLLTFLVTHGGPIRDDAASLCEALDCDPGEVSELMTPKLRRCFRFVDGFLVGDEVMGEISIGTGFRPNRGTAGTIYLLAPADRSWWKLGYTSKSADHRCKQWSAALGELWILDSWDGCLGDELDIHMALRGQPAPRIATREAYLDLPEARRTVVEMTGRDPWGEN